MHNESNKTNGINELAAIARRAETARLAPAARARILAETRRAPGAMARLAALWGLSGQLVAAAALLALLVLPAVMQRGADMPATPGRRADKLDLSVHMRADGAVVLEWNNGGAVHTVRKAGSREDLAKVNAIEVQGGRFTDAAGPVSGGPDIVFYQVD